MDSRLLEPAGQSHLRPPCRMGVGPGSLGDAPRALGAMGTSALGNAGRVVVVDSRTLGGAGQVRLPSESYGRANIPPERVPGRPGIIRHSVDGEGGGDSIAPT